MGLKTTAGVFLQADWAKKRLRFKVGEFTPGTIIGGVQRYNSEKLNDIRDSSPRLLKEAINTKLWDAEKFYYQSMTPFLYD